MRISVKEYINQLSEQLVNLYTPPEAQQVIFLVLEDILHIRKEDQLMNVTKEVLPPQQEEIQSCLQLLIEGQPLQYVLGKAHFYGRDFLINPSVLIPRPETEQLVRWALDDCQGQAMRILDVGTGSGCLAITLALELKDAQVYALDVMPAALKVAQQNAHRLQAKIHFMQLDILNDVPELNDFEVIICNPPYVPESDLANMQSLVKDHEPHKALFVPDEDPLKFYARMANIGPTLLSAGGRLYLEIYHAYGEQVATLFKGASWQEVELRKDLQGKDRMIKAVMS